MEFEEFAVAMKRLRKLATERVKGLTIWRPEEVVVVRGADGKIEGV